jgi:hypothetical protein
MPNAGAFTYWYLQVPNLILWAMITLLALRLLLLPVFGDGGGLVRPVRAITQPVVATVGAVTPGIVPRAGVMFCAIVWLFALRVLLFMAASAMGARL